MSFRLKALKVSQPLSDFYVTKVKAKDLLKVSFSEELTYTNEKGELKGSQRSIREKRLKEIARYIDSTEMAFPNSIILAANYSEDGELIDDDEKRWALEKKEEDLYDIIIPTYDKLAVIIDGQHRLRAFDFVENKERLDVELLCSFYFDLPNTYQAYLFATINTTQKKVDKSLALEQFGFNVEEEPRKSWTPEKLAVYFTRKLNFEKDSPFYGHIKIAPKYQEDLLFQKKEDWIVSTATVVDGILGLISSKPKRDRVEMSQPSSIFKGRNRKLLEDIRDYSPLRNLFLNTEDDTIFKIVFDFFVLAKRNLWQNRNDESYIVKTVGIQALFEFLKNILKEKNYQSLEFENYISPAEDLNFADHFFQQASGVGRLRIRNALELKAGLKKLKDMKVEDIDEYSRVTNILQE